MASTAQSSHVKVGPQLDNRRMAAAAIDLAAPGLALLAVIAGGLLTPAVVVVLLGWTLYYFFALESGSGQTIGKRAMHIKVVTADGGKPTMRQFASRNAVRALDLPLVGLVAMLVSGDRRQRLGDVAAATMVVDANSESPAGSMAETAQLEPVGEMTEVLPKAKRSRPSLGGPALKLPSFGRSKKSPAAMDDSPAEMPVAPVAMPVPPVAMPDAPVAAMPEAPVAMPDLPAAAMPEAPVAAPKSKSSRPTLGGPELKMPSFGRRKKAKKAATVADAPAAPAKPTSSRPTLGGPELKMPSFGRSKKAKKAAAAEAPAAPGKPKNSRPTLGGPELKLPSFGRRKRAQAPASEPTLPAVPQPAAAPVAAVPELLPEAPSFDPYSAEAPAASVEVVRPDDEPDRREFNAEVNERLEGRAPDVRVLPPEPEPAAPAPQPVASPAPTRPPAIPGGPVPAVSVTGPEDPPVPEPAPTAAAELPAPEPSEAIRDDGSPELHVKPIETVSPMELLMQETQGRDKPDPDSSL
jgi:uncharacterized RDD family membrane protein YckC